MSSAPTMHMFIKIAYPNTKSGQSTESILKNGRGKSEKIITINFFQDEILEQANFSGF
jgi:hypothetical protein